MSREDYNRLLAAVLFDTSQINRLERGAGEGGERWRLVMGVQEQEDELEDYLAGVVDALNDNEKRRLLARLKRENEMALDGLFAEVVSRTQGEPVEYGGEPFTRARLKNLNYGWHWLMNELGEVEPEEEPIDNGIIQTILGKAIEAGFMEKGEGSSYKWLKPKVWLGYLLYKLYDDNMQPIPFKQYEKLFQLKRLDNTVQQIINAKNPQKWRGEIDNLFE